MLPIGVVPLTAVVTRLRYGPAEKAEVRFLNGTAKAVSPEDIGLDVGEDASPASGRCSARACCSRLSGVVFDHEIAAVHLLAGWRCLVGLSG